MSEESAWNVRPGGVWRGLNGKSQTRHEREPNVIQGICVDLLATEADREGSDTLSYCLPNSLLTSHVSIPHCSVFSLLKTRFNLKRDGSALAWLRLNRSLLPLL